MVMCIFTAIIGPIMMVIEGVIAGVTALVFTCPTLIHPLSDIRVLGIQLISSSICTIFGEEAAMFIHGILSFIGLVEFVVAVVGSAFCCDGLCCGKSPRRVSPENDVWLVLPLESRSNARTIFSEDLDPVNTLALETPSKHLLASV
ncbi:uncharacterized protein [Diadema setosum]|uniref:uncharacterized protein n=1 Tax=Diadema setosum TaxID=31175 RepID=UPI003B3AD146